MSGPFARRRYYILTFDWNDPRDFTTQEGVPVGPHRLFALRYWIMVIGGMGYDLGRSDRGEGDGNVLILEEKEYRRFMNPPKRKIRKLVFPEEGLFDSV